MVGEEARYAHLDNVQGVVKMNLFKPFEDKGYEDFFNRYSLQDYTDKMAEFKEK